MQSSPRRPGARAGIFLPKEKRQHARCWRSVPYSLGGELELCLRTIFVISRSSYPGGCRIFGISKFFAGTFGTPRQERNSRPSVSSGTHIRKDSPSSKTCLSPGAPGRKKSNRRPESPQKLSADTRGVLHEQAMPPRHMEDPHPESAQDRAS